MKKYVNSFAITGFVATDAEIRKFQTSSVARFPLSISRKETHGEETTRTSALISVEAWRKNDNNGCLDLLKKGTLVTVEGYLKPEEWTDDDGKHNKVKFNATKIYPADDGKEESKAETPAPAEK